MGFSLSLANKQVLDDDLKMPVVSLQMSLIHLHQALCVSHVN